MGKLKLRLITLAIIVISFSVSAATFGIPRPGVLPAEFGKEPLAFSLLLAMDTFFVLTHIGGTMLFLLGLRSFGYALRYAFIFIIIGLIIESLANLQAPISFINNDWESLYWRTGGFNIIYIVGSILIFYGIVKLAKTFEADSFFSSYKNLALVGLLTTVIIIFLPHAAHHATPTPEYFYDMSISLMAFNVVMQTFFTLAMLKIKRNAGLAYQNTFAWTFLSFATNTLSGYFFVYIQIAGSDGFFAKSGLMFLPFLIAGLLLVKAGYSFNKITKF